MTTRRDIIKSLCAISILPVVGNHFKNYSLQNSNDQILQVWAHKHAMLYVTRCVMFDEKFIDEHNNRYIAVWPINFALFKLQDSNELRKMIVEFPKDVRQIIISNNHLTKLDFSKPLTDLYGQIKPFMVDYAKSKWHCIQR